MKKLAAVTLAVLFVAVILGCGGVAKAPKGKDVLPGGNGPAARECEAFDPADSSKSILWLACANGKIAEKGSGNLMVEKSYEERFKELLASVQGQKVRWPVEVRSVSREGGVAINVSGAKLTAQEARRALPGAEAKTDYELVWEPIFPQPKPKPKRKGEAAGDVGLASPDKEWLKTLRTGDVVVLAATIKRVSLRRTYHEEYAAPRRGEFRHFQYWEVYLEDTVVEPK
jgi:hypothetical protein